MSIGTKYAFAKATYYHLADSWFYNPSGQCLVSNGAAWEGTKVSNVRVTFTHVGSGCSTTQDMGGSNETASNIVRNYFANGANACNDPTYYNIGEMWDLSVAVFKGGGSSPVFESSETVTVDCAGDPWWQGIFW